MVSGLEERVGKNCDGNRRQGKEKDGVYVGSSEHVFAFVLECGSVEESRVGSGRVNGEVGVRRHPMKLHEYCRLIIYDFS